MREGMKLQIISMLDTLDSFQLLHILCCNYQKAYGILCYNNLKSYAMENLAKSQLKGWFWETEGDPKLYPYHDEPPIIMKTTSSLHS